MAVDGISKQFEDFINNVLGQVGTETKEAIIEEVDNFTEQYVDDLKKTTPKKTGRLIASLKTTKINKRNYYGNEVEYFGENENGEPYEKIANILNYGTKDGRIQPKRFVNKAIRKLKKLDPAINENFEQRMQNLNNKA